MWFYIKVRPAELQEIRANAFNKYSLKYPNRHKITSQQGYCLQLLPWIRVPATKPWHAFFCCFGSFVFNCVLILWVIFKSLITTFFYYREDNKTHNTHRPHEIRERPYWTTCLIALNLQTALVPLAWGSVAWPVPRPPPVGWWCDWVKPDSCR